MNTVISRFQLEIVHFLLITGDPRGSGLWQFDRVILIGGPHGKNGVLLHIQIVWVLEVLALLRESPSVRHSEALSGLAKGQIHAVVLLLLRVHLLDSIGVLHH